MRRHLPVLLVLLLVTPALSTTVEAEKTITLNDTVTVQAAAVSRTPDGLVGSTADIEVTVAPNGSGHVFMDTSSFTQVDMQGSAKLATRVASSLTGLPRDQHDYFYVVDTPSPIIGGPSAGAEMAVATVAALKGWSVDEHVIMTGTVNLDGTVGPVGGIPEKAEAARDAGAGLFLFPEGQANATTDGEQVHVPTYCDRELGITCEPVATVREATEHMTGHRFPKPEPAGNVTGRDYRTTLRPLGHDLLDRSNRTIDNATAALESADLSPEAEENLRSRLDDARSTRDDAADAVTRGRYYTGASRAFQATVGARTVDEAVTILTDEGPDLRYQGRAGAAHGRIQDAEDAAASHEIEGLTELQAVGAAQSRVLGAEERLNASREAWRNAGNAGEAIRAIGDLAFAFERAETVHWWLRIGDAFPPGPSVNRTELQAAAEDVVATARDSVAYARLLSQKKGGQNPLVQEASSLLGSALEARDRGLLAASIYDAIQAESWASIGLSTAGLPQETVESRVDRARDRSGAAIEEARAVGVEPILAEAYYEFAGDFQNPVQALAYYGLSGTIARSTSAFQTADADPNPSRFVGVHPAAEPATTLQGPDEALGLVALSFTAGVGLAIVALIGRGRWE